MKIYDYETGLWYHEPPSHPYATRVTLRRGLETEHFGSLWEASEWLGYARGYLASWIRDQGDRTLLSGWTVEVEGEE